MVSFSRAGFSDRADTRDTETKIFRDGAHVGYILRESMWERAPLASVERGGPYRRYVVNSYDVVFTIDDVQREQEGWACRRDDGFANDHDECFNVDDYGHPRTALAAAKAYARATLKREGEA